MKKYILLFYTFLFWTTGTSAQNDMQLSAKHTEASRNLTSIYIMGLNSSEEWVLTGENHTIPLQRDTDIIDCDGNRINHPLHPELTSQKVRITYTQNMENIIHVQKVEIICQ